MEAAFFDLDKTVIAKASMAAFGRQLYDEGLISRSTILRGLWAHLLYLHLGASERRLARIQDSVLVLTKGWSQARVNQIVAETLQVVVEPITYAEALELMADHRRAGRRVYLVSASPSEIVEPLARYLGVDRAIASRARIDDAGCYTGELDVYAYGPYKAELIRKVAERDGVDLARSYAYSDSYTDLPMLEAVGHPVAVNPDRVLRRAAGRRGWPVRRFVHPVRLDGRPPVTHGRATAAAMLSVALAGTAAAAWRVRHRVAPAVALPAPRRPPASRRERAAGWLVEVSRRAAS
jgi:HAD superfamily hydrolase (TIGR01490 family)